MAIFRGENSRRLIGLALIIVFGGYQLVANLPASHNVFHFAQTSVALLALAALVFLVAQHHMREGEMLTEAQEELIFIGGFGLFWLVTLTNLGGLGRSVQNVRSVFSAMLIAWQAYRSRGLAPTGAALTPTVDVRGASQGSGTTGGQRPCSPDAAYCVVEEWSYSYW